MPRRLAPTLQIARAWRFPGSSGVHAEELMKAITIAFTTSLILVTSTVLAGVSYVVEARYADGSLIDSGTYYSTKETRAFREKVKDKVCDDKGKGNHTWFYKVGKQKPVKSTAFCK